MWGRSSTGDRPPGVCLENQSTAGETDDHGPICMKPPVIFKWNPKDGYSLCMACNNWRQSNHLFHHEGIDWILCVLDYADYWENTEVLLDDFKWYHPPRKRQHVR